MTRNCRGIDFTIEDQEAVAFGAEDAAEGVSLETGADGGEAGFDPGDAEAPAEMELPEAEETAEMEVGDPVIVTGIYPEYEGPTTVVSRIGAETVLETAMTTVMSDITVERIPVWEVSNPAGGVTVTIGRN